MPISQFDKPWQGSYVSSYIPLPFEELSNIAQQKQQQHLAAESALDKVKDPLNFNLAKSLKVYNGNGIGDVQLPWQQQLGEETKSLDLQKQKLVDDYASHTITNEDFTKGVKSLMSKSQDIYSRYKPLENVSKQIQQQSELIGKNADFGADTVLGHKYLDYNTKYLQDILEGNIGDYNPVDIAKPYDINEDVNKAVQNFEETDLGSGASTGQYIREIEKYGVQSPRVIDYVDSTWHNSSNYRYADDMAKQYIATGRISPNQYKDFMNEAKDAYKHAIVDKVVHERKKENLQADPYSLFNYKQRYKDNKEKEALISSVGIVEGENIINYDYNPEVSGFINPKTGQFDLNYGMSKTEEDWSKPQTVTIDGKKYDANTIDKNKYKLEQNVSGLTAIDKKTGKRIDFTRDRNPQNDLNEARNYILKQATRLGLEKDFNESEEQFANRVLNENKLHSQGVTKNVEIDPEVASKMDQYLIGKDGNKFSTYYDDAIILGEKNPKPINEFLKDQEIDLKTIKHNTVSFDKKHPGYVLFSATNKDGETVQFYAKSRNENFKNSLEGATKVTNIFKDYYAGKDMPVKNVNIEGNKYTAIGEPLREDGMQFLALNSNREPVLVNIRNKNGKFTPIETSVSDLKINSVLDWMQSNEAKPYTRKIKENKNFEFDEE